jgi:glycosyltransferase involved in cell wall biosynthesis
MTAKRDGRRPVVCMVAYSDYIYDARIRREAETLVADGFRVVCLRTRGAGDQVQYIFNGVEIRELNVRKYQGKNRYAYLRSYLRFLLAASRVCLGLLATDDLDVVHVHNLPDFLVVAALIPRIFGRKVVLDVHDSIPETFATKFSNGSLAWKMLCLEEKVSARLADRVICVNEPQQKVLVGRGIPTAKTFVSMNVPDPKIFKRSTGCQGTKAKDLFDVVYHGTMADRLGVDLIIRAAAKLKDRVALRLHLWGNGDDLPRFHALAKELGTESSVDFVPGYPLQELPLRLATMDLGVVGNRRSMATELMLPVKLMEYICLGIPVVVPRLHTIEHYFSDEMVTYYEPGDVDSFAAAIERMHANPQLRCRQAEHAGTFLDQYGWERQGGELVRFYEELVESRL